MPVPDVPDVNADFDSAPAALMAWFVDEAWRLTSPRKLTLEACRRLVRAGVPLHQFNVFIFTLHPDYFGVTHRWSRETDAIESFQGAHSLVTSDTVTKSPIATVFEGVAGLRRRLDRPGFVPDFEVLEDYIAAGATDYVLMRLEFTDGSPHCITMTTDRPGGFNTAELCLVGETVPHMSRLAEIQAVRYLATTLLDTYVGHDAGRRVMTGTIRRGSGETIHAVIWLCDLRDFAKLGDSLPRDELIGLLNDYFDCVGPPVRARGGEILKFMGDAMLAIFRVEGPEAAAEACETALAAAAESETRLAELNARRKEDGRPAIDFGVALHIGDVMYGNIGTGDRLDFTVIGPAVNLAARLESLCPELGRPVVVSADFAAAARQPLTALGAHALKGIAGRHQVFCPGAEAAEARAAEAVE